MADNDLDMNPIEGDNPLAHPFICIPEILDGIEKHLRVLALDTFRRGVVDGVFKSGELNHIYISPEKLASNEQALAGDLEDVKTDP
jgi:hypothetical protein